MSMNTKRSLAENEAEATLAKVQELKNAVLRSHGVSEESKDDGLWQGDIILSMRQAEKLLQHYTPAHKRDSLYFEQHPENVWPMPITWTTDGNFASGDMDKIRAALQLITTAAPCITFQEATSVPSSGNYIQYQSAGTGTCQGAAYVGMQQGENGISMDISGCVGMGPNGEDFSNLIVTHETLHNLGLDHEQSRNDRDMYLKINMDNVAKTDQNNFEINPEGTSYGIPFNFKSIMMYGTETLAVDTSICSICPLTDVAANTAAMGNSNNLQDTDTQFLNKMYCKAATCKDAQQSCGQSALYTSGFCSDASNQQSCAKSCNAC